MMKAAIRPEAGRTFPAGIRKTVGLLLLCATILATGWMLMLAGCAKDDAPDALPGGVDTAFFSGLFRNFIPQYNFIGVPTEMMGHVAYIEGKGFAPWQACYGSSDSSGTGDISTSSLFRVGSSTKMFTATIILQLWEEGLLDLDHPFNEYLGLEGKDYPTIGEFNDVTIRHLLSHRSGVPRISSTTFFDHHDFTDPITQLERMHFLFTDGHPEFEPGTQYGYRNSNFNILGLVIERVAGKPYHEVLRERICTPAGLKNTWLLDYDISPADSRIAHGYTQGFDGTLYHGSQAWAAGGLVSTAGDLGAFMASLVNGILFRHASTFSMMVDPEPGSPYGLGIFVSQTPEGLAYGHGGAIFGYNTRLEYFPAADATVVSTMSFNGYDFMVMNWYEDFCYPVIREIRKFAD